MKQRIASVLLFLLCVNAYADDNYPLTFGRESDGIIEVFYIDKEKAKSISEIEPKRDFYKVMSVDVLQIARSWARNNLGSGFKVANLNVAHTVNEGLRVWYYFVTVDNFHLHPIDIKKRIRKSFVVLSNNEVVVGKHENSVTFFKKLRGE